MTRISYLGPAGTFTEAALFALTGAGMVPGSDHHDHQPVPADSTPAALDAVRSGAVDYACVPIENSIEGGVTPTLDALAAGSPLQIFAETALDVTFSVVVAAGRAVADIRTVAAHPVAGAQVRRWLAEHLPQAHVVPANSNAAAAQQVCDGEVDAGVSTALAAKQRGLVTLADGVIDEPNARTRFVLVGAPAPPPARTGADRTSVVLRLDNAPGALAAALTEFGSRGIDLTRIESRPTRARLGTYLFFLDCVGHIDDGVVGEALEALRRSGADVRYLGSWPAGPAGGCEAAS
ncbi:prephenate dehydratase [Mycolicibacter longobardus]|uniref:Prephenate dehydratase n=1 Tax=Mycolicibacter longobardus TaxID=1108812 RepID=A0A1X1YHE2_9MYCO|nr:prephenate dehydratase [Mycolicibacter longobardus]MCV7382329.1 prephenate dehydratase [Mycolicibacter longobardus]ORW10464.1 prephenate dehydratase [Mycolicibacter longobardus]